jgi:Tol biopolymer transport system component
LPLARGSDINAWSPDSGTVAYVSGGGIFGISALGGPSRRLVRVRSRGKQLASVSVDWSSRGELAFSDVGGIYTARPDGTALRRVTTKGDAPSWSSDGRRLAFAHDGEIFVVGRRGGGLRQLTRWRVDSEPRLSPDGSRIAFTRGGGSYTASRPESVYLIGGAGGGRRLVGAGSDARWSPDGRRLAYIDHVRVESKRSPAIDRVVVFDVDSRTRTSVATGTSPAWSPDGERIAFMRYRFSRATHGWEIGSSSLLTIRADGSDLHELTSASEFQLYAPAWSPDGKTIAVYAVDVESHVEFVDPNTGATHLLDVDVGRPLVWSPLGDELLFAEYASIGILDVETGKARTLLQSDKLAYRDVVWSPDGRQVGFIRCASPEPEDCDVYAMNADGTDQRRLTRTRGLEYGLDWGSAG